MYRRPGPRFTRGRIATAGGNIPSPLEIFGASAIKLWFDFSDPANYTITGQGYSQVNNKGDAALIAAITQGTDARRPRKYPQRGREASWHVAGQQRWMSAGAFSAAIPQPFTVLSVRRSMGTGTTTGYADAANSVLGQTLNASWPVSLRFSAGTNLTATNAIAQDECYSCEFFANGGSSAIYKNGVSQISGNAGAGTWDQIWIGSSGTPSAYITGQETEFLIINRAITAPERAAMETYFASRWKHTDSYRHVMMIGDSITLGTNSTDGDGARRMLFDDWSMAQVSGYWPTEMGDVLDHLYPGDRHHAVSGIGLDALKLEIDTVIASGLTPHVVWMMCCTNDCRNLAPASYVPEPDASSTLDRYDNFVRTMATGWPNARFVLSTVPDCNPSQTTAQSNINDFNAGLPARWAQMVTDGLKVHTVDLRADLGAWSADNYGADQFHPNDTGYAIMKATMKTGIQAALALV